MNARPTSSQPRRRSAGFTLVELLGVLAVMALLSAIVVASALKQLKQGQRDSENKSLDGLADAFTNLVKGTYTVQSATNWVSPLAVQLSLPPKLVGTNLSGNARVIWMDPTMQLGATTNAPTFPFVQGIAGSAVQPSNVRFLIISSLTDPLPSLSGLAFSNVWNTAVNTQAHRLADKLDRARTRIWRSERIALHGLFYRLMLNNLDPTNAATWTLSSSATNTTLASGARLETWVLDGTTVSLTDLSGMLSIRDILRADDSYVYEGGKWLRRVSKGAGGGSSTGAFGSLIDQFLAAPVPAGANKDAMGGRGLPLHAHLRVHGR